MSRAEFLRLLRWRLAQMPQSEIEKNVAYYDEMFSDMIEDGMTEEEAAARLGDPEEIAKELLRDMPMSELVRSRVRPSGGWTAFSILLAVVLCPIWAAAYCCRRGRAGAVHRAVGGSAGGAGGSCCAGNRGGNACRRGDIRLPQRPMGTADRHGAHCAGRGAAGGTWGGVAR